MAVDLEALRLVHFPAPVLRERARPVPEVTDEVRAVAERMIQIMHQAEGIGLAAPQVGLAWRLFVASVPEGEDRSVDSNPPTASPEPEVFINPSLVSPRAKLEVLEEGCLSLPGIRGDVARPAEVTIKATDLQGREFTRHGAGLLARCWQHELDHLEGVLIIDKFTQMSRLRNRAALKELSRRARA